MKMKMPIVSPKDAEILEDWEQTELKHKRTRRAIQDTYRSSWSTARGAKTKRKLDEDEREFRTSNRPFTKKRRALPGKRRWKNKDTQYVKLQGQMTVESFNKKQKADAALKRIYKKQAKLMQPDES